MLNNILSNHNDMARDRELINWKNTLTRNLSTHHECGWVEFFLDGLEFVQTGTAQLCPAPSLNLTSIIKLKRNMFSWNSSFYNKHAQQTICSALTVTPRKIVIICKNDIANVLIYGQKVRQKQLLNSTL